MGWRPCGGGTIWLVNLGVNLLHGHRILHAVAPLMGCGNFAVVFDDSWRAYRKLICVVLFWQQICHWWCCFRCQCVGSAWRSRQVWSTWGQSCCRSKWQCTSCSGMWPRKLLGGGITNKLGCIWLWARRGRNCNCVGLHQRSFPFLELITQLPVARWYRRWWNSSKINVILDEVISRSSSCSFAMYFQ